MTELDERRARCGALRGATLTPSYATSAHDTWGAACRRDVLARELRFMRRLGLDSVRLWQSALTWEHDPEEYEATVRFALDTCRSLGLTAVVVAFDSCGTEPIPEHPEWRTLEEAAARQPREHLINRMEAAFAISPPRELHAPSAIVEVPDRGEGTEGVWQTWAPNPGYALLGAEHDERWGRYASWLGRLCDSHPAVAAVEVMNEPFVTQILRSVDLAPVRRFYREMQRRLRDAAPSLPLSIGAESVERFVEYDADMDAPLDFVNVHLYAYTADRFRELLEPARALAAQRRQPLLISEWGAWPGSHDEGQLGLYRDVLPVLLESDAGWMLFHVVAGYGPFALSALLYPNGVMRPAARHLRAALAPRS